VRKLKWIIVVALVPVVVGTYLLWVHVAPPAVLGQMLARFRTADTIQVEGEYFFDMPIFAALAAALAPDKPGQADDLKDRFQAAYQSPNRVYFRLGDEEKAIVEAACDGENMYLRTIPLEQVFKSPASEDLQKLRAQTDMDKYVPGPSGGVDLFIFAEKGFELTDVKSARFGLPKGSEWLASLNRPPGTWVVTVEWRNEDASSLVLWIDKDTYLPRQAAIESRGLEEFASGIGAEPVLMTHLLIYERVAIGEPIAEATFSMALPEDTEVIEVDSIEQIEPARQKALKDRIQRLRQSSRRE